MTIKHADIVDAMRTPFGHYGARHVCKHGYGHGGT